MNKFVMLILLISAFPLAASQNVTSSLPMGVYLNSVSEDCPFTYEDVENRIEGEFLRARLDPKPNEFFNLWITVQCMRITNGGEHSGNVVSMNLMYGSIIDEDFMLFPENQGGMLIAGSDATGDQYLLNGTSNLVADAITKFLRNISM